MNSKIICSCYVINVFLYFHHHLLLRDFDLVFWLLFKASSAWVFITETWFKNYLKSLVLKHYSALELLCKYIFMHTQTHTCKRKCIGLAYIIRSWIVSQWLVEHWSKTSSWTVSEALRYRKRRPIKSPVCC